MSLSPTMTHVLEECRRRARLGVGIISNGDAGLQEEKLDILGIWRWVERQAVFVSQAVGLAKPDPALFDYACARMGTEPGRCVYVGDAWDTDVVGAHAAGMPCVWLNRRGRARPSDAGGVSPAWEVVSEEGLESLVGSERFWELDCS